MDVRESGERLREIRLPPRTGVRGHTFSVGWAPTLSQYFTRSKFKTTCFVALPSGKGSYLRWKVHDMRDVVDV
jgi:hypothetical protein